jgi:hypothetical protein
MRGINISNDKKRDAKVGFQSFAKKPYVKTILPDGEEKRNVKVLSATSSAASLVKKHGDLLAAGNALIKNDDETDIENVGRILGKTRKLYINKDNEIAYRVNMVQIVRNPDGSEKSRSGISSVQANIAGELPLVWTGRKFSKADAVRKFVFTQKYQICHTNGLTYDFLYDMAKQLAGENALMFLGAGKKGTDPIIITSGGQSYRGFLEGRIKEDGYMLILHLTNLEVKPLTAGEVSGGA